MKITKTSQEHTVDFCKKLAKTLAREKQIPHHKALDDAAKLLGFQNWKSFLVSRPSKALIAKSIGKVL